LERSKHLPVAIITGVSRGLGKEIALTFGRNGYNVAVNYHTSHSEATNVADKIRNAILIKSDVGDMQQVKEMSDMIYKKWGRVDVLVNNAGITSDDLIVRLEEKKWDEVMKTNLKGCFNTIKCFSEMMKKNGGHIVNISSYSGLKGNEGQAAYSASKAAIIGLTYTVAKELAEYNIKVNAITPGYMQTEMGMSSVEAMESAKSASILGRLSSAGDVAEFIANLTKTNNITGQVFCLESRII
jgi:3-oxoacyl-[acyl-carrier protein] reductase